MNIGILLDVSSVGLHAAIVRSILLKSLSGQTLKDTEYDVLDVFNNNSAKYLEELCTAWAEARNGTQEDDLFFEQNAGSDELWTKIFNICHSISVGKVAAEDFAQAIWNLERIGSVCSMVRFRSGLDHPRF